MIPEAINYAIDKYKCRIPTDDELTELFDLINSSGLKLKEKEEACNYLQRLLDEAPANIKAEEERQARRNAEKIRQKQLAAQRKEKISERIWQTGFAVGITLMIVLPFFNVNFWIEMLIIVPVVMGSLFYSIYYRDGHL